MKDILKSLFMGEVDPSDVAVPQTEEYREAGRKLERYELELTQQLTQQQEELYIKLSNVMDDLNLMEHAHFFKQGFALAVQLLDAAARESLETSLMRSMAEKQ